MKSEMPVPNMAREYGYTGLRTFSGSVFEESRRDLVFPQSIFTYDKMSQHITIATALNVQHAIAARAPFYVEAFSQSNKHRKQAEFFTQCMNDMEHTWYSFMQEALSMLKYGFSVHEIVFRYREAESGSKYSDGKVGIRKLPIRSQASIKKWMWNEQGSLTGVLQSVVSSHENNTKSVEIEIPYSKLLHFRVDHYKGNPEGVSPLNSCYHSWRMLQKLQDNELVATAKNLNGVPRIRLPAKYMSPDATPAEKDVYEALKTIGQNTNNGEQAVVILPSDQDDLGNHYFDFDVIDSSSSNSAAVDPIIKRYSDEIMKSLFVDSLQSTPVAMQINQTPLVEVVVGARLQEICDTINSVLIPKLWSENGWDSTQCPKLCFGELSRAELSVWAKAMQQLAATNNVAKTPRNINYVAEMLNLPERLSEDLSKEELDAILGVDTTMQSRSGDGMAVGKVGEGTGDVLNGEDKNASNLSSK